MKARTVLSPIAERFKLKTASYIDWDERENIHNRGLHDMLFFPSIISTGCGTLECLPTVFSSHRYTLYGDRYLRHFLCKMASEKEAFDSLLPLHHNER